MQRRDNGVARATGATRDSSTTEDAQGFLRMFPGVMEIALERMFHTCCRDFFIATRFPFYVKAGFFIVFSLVFSLFWAREGLQVGPQLGAMLEVVLGGVLERCWEVFWEVFGGQDGAKTVQVGPKTAQDGL